MNKKYQSCLSCKFRESTKMREVWLEEIARASAISGGDPDAQNSLKTMLRKMSMQAINAKLNRIAQGERTGMDYIEVSEGDRNFSKKK